MKKRKVIPNSDNSTNFNQVSDGKTIVGPTLDNLKAAIAGETGATTKYTAYARAAKDQGYDHIARLFEATAAAELIHIGLEYDLVIADDPEYSKPEADDPKIESSDLNLISGAYGEMYETSDMYPAFIQKAKEEGHTKAMEVFTRAKLAEAVHAELYLQAYNDLDSPDEDVYYLCPICGYIHKGSDFTTCPICFTPKPIFKEF